MKKSKKVFISILVIALMVCAVSTTAFAASAPMVSASTDSADPGTEITFTITTNNTSVLADVVVSGPLTYVGNSGASQSTDHNFVTFNNPTVTYTYTVNADAAPGTPYLFTIANITVSDEDGNEEEMGSRSVAGSVTGEIPAASEEPAVPEEPAEPEVPAASAVDGSETTFPVKTLPAGTTYYTMVNGAPGASHTLNKATAVSVIEKMPNGYTKVMIGTTTYLVKSATVSSGSSSNTAKLDRAPKTGDATQTTWALAFVTIAAAAGAGIFALKKVTAK